uniref:Predicted protein n=1 Tax=Hordeum vulgare subsp. vulgare TaxID=112509 RepID=F2DJD7_HORVV|nr:predicted protein [Hordeum vulgare subsp. vulgare]
MRSCRASMTGAGAETSTAKTTRSCSKFSFPKLYSTRVLIFPIFHPPQSMEWATTGSSEAEILTFGRCGQEVLNSSLTFKTWATSTANLERRLSLCGRPLLKQLTRIPLTSHQQCCCTRDTTVGSALSAIT